MHVHEVKRHPFTNAHKAGTLLYTHFAHSYTHTCAREKQTQAHT